MTEPKKYTGKETVLGWFNSTKAEVLGKEMTVADVDFSLPIRNETSDPQYNTTIIIKPKLGTMFIGNYTFNYDRIHSSVFGLVLVNKGDASTFYELLDKVNEECNTLFTEDDLEDYPLSIDVSGEIVVDLLFKPESVMYYGGQIIYTPINPEPPPPDPDDPDTGPTYPPVGTKIGEYCQGPDVWGVFANGSGGYYNEVISTNVPSCGYVPGPAPVYTNVNGPNWDDDRNVNIVSPGSAVVLQFTLDKTSSRGLYFDVYFIWYTASMSDILSIEFMYPGGAWQTVPNTLTFLLPRDKLSFAIRLNIKPGIALLPTKNLDVDIRVNPVSMSFINPGAVTTCPIIIERAVYESLLTLANTALTINEGSNSQLVYNMDQPIADSTELEIWFDYGVNLTKKFTGLQYSCTATSGNVVNQPFELSASTNKFKIPLPLGTTRVTVAFYATYDVEHSTTKLCTIKTQEFTITPKLVMVSNGTSLIPGWTSYAIEVKTPATIPNNTLLDTYCVDFEKWGKYWFSGSVVPSLIETDSSYCGFVSVPSLRPAKLTARVSNIDGGTTYDSNGHINDSGNGFYYVDSRSSKNRTDAIPPGKYYVEITRIDPVYSNALGFGVCLTSLLDDIGETKGFIAYTNAFSGYYYNRFDRRLNPGGRYAFIYSDYGPNPLPIQNTIGCRIDTINGTMGLIIDGVDYGDTHELPVDQDIYFAVGGSGNGVGGVSSLYINFGQETFKNTVPAGFNPGLGWITGPGDPPINPSPAIGVLTPTKLIGTDTPNESYPIGSSGHVAIPQTYRLFSTEYSTDSGKYYFEVNFAGYGDEPIMFGLINEAFDLYPTPQEDGSYWGIGRRPGSIGVATQDGQLVIAIDSTQMYNGNENSFGYDKGYGVLLDFDTKKFSVILEAGISPAISFSTITGLMKFAIGYCNYDSTTPPQRSRCFDINFGQRPFEYTVPAGYNPGFGPLLGGAVEPVVQATKLIGPVTNTIIGSTKDTLGGVRYSGYNFNYRAGVTSKYRTIAVSPSKLYVELICTGTRNIPESLAFGINKVSDTGLLYIGDNSTSYGFNINKTTGQMYKRNNGVESAYGPVVGSGAIIGLKYDGVDGSIEVSVNGVGGGQAFIGINTEDIYFVIGSSSVGSGNDYAYINFGQHTFKYLPAPEYSGGFGSLVSPTDYVPRVVPANGILTPTKLLDVSNTAETITIGNFGYVLLSKVTRLYVSEYSATTGKYYFEVSSLSNTSFALQFGFVKTDISLYPLDEVVDDDYGAIWGSLKQNGLKGFLLDGSMNVFTEGIHTKFIDQDYDNTANVLYDNNTIGIMVDFGAKTVSVIINGGTIVSAGTIPGATQPLKFAIGMGYFEDVGNLAFAVNFGQEPFMNTVPSGYMPGFGQPL